MAEETSRDAGQEPGSTEKKSFWSKFTDFWHRLGDAGDEPEEKEYHVDVKKSVDEAQLLLEYVASQGKEIDPKIVSTVVTANRIIKDKDKWTEQAETDFWIIFNKLADMVKPVTITSLKANSDRHGRIPLRARLFPRFYKRTRISEAREVVNRKKIWTTVTLVLLLFTQVYWFVGNAIITSLNPDKWLEAKTAAENKRYELSQLVLVENITPREIDQVRNEYQSAQKLEKNLRQYISGNIGMLNKWNEIWKTFTFLKPTQEAKFNITAETLENLKDAEVPGSVLQKLQSSLGKETTGTEAFMKSLRTGIGEDELNNYGYLIVKYARANPGASYQSAKNETDDLDFVPLNESIKSAQFALSAISTYLLPLLYGLLGAFAYVLRSLTNEVKNLTYSRESNIRYGLRLQLGALAGLAIGWFVKPEDANLSLSSWALAFLAGYSVEVLFAAMDKFITAFSEGSKPGDERPAANQAELQAEVERLRRESARNNEERTASGQSPAGQNA